MVSSPSLWRSDSRRTSLRMDDGREISAAPERLRHIDHGYASTSHSGFREQLLIE